MQTTPRRFFILIYLACLSFALSFAACTTAPAPVPTHTVGDILTTLTPLASTLAALPLATQAAADQGILAVKQQDYLLAIQNFQDARKTAPDAPELFFNLGLAEANIPGRELRAIAWFGAYLAANPNSLNATTVEDLIAALKRNVRSNLSPWIESQQDYASNLPSADGDRYSFGVRDSFLSDVTITWAAAGDFAAALKTANLIQNPITKSKAQSAIAAAEAREGDEAEAQRTWGLAVNSVGNYASWLYYYYPDSPAPAEEAFALRRIADDRAQAGDITGALKMAGQMDEGMKSAVQSDTAAYQAQAGDIAGAQRTAALISDTLSKNKAQVAIVEAQAAMVVARAKADDIAAALKTAELIPDVNIKINSESRIVEIQAQAGDVAGALNTAELFQDAYFKSSAQSVIAAAQASAGDVAGAQRTWASALNTTELIQEVGAKSHAQGVIATAQARAGDVASALKTVELIQDGSYKSMALVEIAAAKAKLGNFPASTPSSTTTIPVPVQAGVPAFAVSVWLAKLEDTNPKDDCPLSTAPFLDLADYLIKRPALNSAETVTAAQYATATKILKAKTILDQMLTQQSKK